MSDAKRPMTTFAQAVLAASDLIRTKFQNVRFGGSVRRVVQVEAPQVESTGGGRQARESIVLKPESGDSAQAITAGFVDVGLRSTEMRSYTAIAMLYQQRHKTTLDLPEAEYNKFLQDLEQLLTAEGFVFKLVDAQEQLQKSQPKEKQPAPVASSNTMMFLMAAGGTLIVALLVLLLLLKK